MTKEYLGATNCDDGFADYTYFPLAGAASSSPTKVDSGPHSRGGWSYTGGIGGQWIDAFEARSKDKYWLYASIKFTLPASAITDTYAFIYSKYNGSVSPANGHLRVMFSVTPAGVVSWGLQEYNGGWTLLASGTSAAGTYNVGDTCYVVWEIDVAGKTTALTVNGTAEIGSTATTNTPVAPGTPSVDMVLTVGKGGAAVTLWEMFVEHGDSGDSANSYSSSSSGLHVFGNYPRADVAGGVWTITNGDPICPTQKWKTVDDPEDAADPGVDYLTNLHDSSTQDQMFEISDQDSGTATVVGVGVVITLSVSTDNPPLTLLVTVPSESGTPTAYTLKGPGTAGHMYKFLKTTPAGNPWTVALFNEAQIGVRDTSATTRKLGMLNVNTIGTAQARPAQATACVATFIPKVILIA